MLGYNFKNPIQVTMTGGPYKTWHGIVLSLSNDEAATMLQVALQHPSDAAQSIQTWVNKTDCTLS